MTSIKDKIIEIAYQIDDLSFPPKTKDEEGVWIELLEQLNDQLCQLDEA